MRFSTTTSAVLALIAVREGLAGPTHAHVHQKFHNRRDLKNVNWNALDWNSMGIDWETAYAEGQSAGNKSPNKAEPQLPASSPLNSTPSTADKSSLDTKPKNESHREALKAPDDTESIEAPKHHSESSKSSSNNQWNKIVGASNHRKVFGLSTPTYGVEVGYVSNVGIPEGSNMIKVSSADDHIFTNEFINTSNEPMTVVIWNKAASQEMKDPLHADANLGASIAPEHAALTIPLSPGESQTVAFLDQSVIGWAQACDARAASGGFSTTWGEAQFNTTGSGYDVSAIQNSQGSNYLMKISSQEASSCDSTETTNMWVTDVSNVGSGSCYIAQSTAHLTTKMGGYAS